MVSSAEILQAQILIVDDQEANVTLLEEMLTEAGYVAISSTTNPRSVYQLHNQNQYSLILLDLQMPEMNGFEVMESLKAIETDNYLPVIVVTAQPTHKLQALRAGARDFVQKPFDLAEVLMRVHNFLESRLLHLETRRLYKEVIAEKRASEQRTLIFRAGPGPVSISLVPEGRIIDANEEYCNFFGHTRGEIDDQSCTDKDRWVNPADRIEMWEQIFREGSVRGFQSRQLHSSGEARDVLSSFELVDLDGESKPVLISMFTDITELKRVEESLRESETKYRDLIEEANDLIFGVSAEGRLLYANRSWRTTLGYAPEAVRTLQLKDLMCPMNYQQFEAFSKEIVGRETAQNGKLIELDFTSKENRRIAVEGSLTASSKDGQPISLLCIFRDVTEKKKMEGQLMRNQRMESVGTLAGGIAHDLNNVLAPILMAVELLKDSIGDDRGRTLLSTLQSSAQRGADLVKQVLSFARGLEGRRIVINPGHIIRDLVTLMRDTFPKSIDVKLLSPRDIWTVTGDPTQMHQVLLNLCVNARDAMPGGGRIAITVSNEILDETYASMSVDAHAGPYLAVKVEDTGCGIPRAVLDRIFEPFFTTKEVGKGTGLGLSTTMAIVKSHGGFINVYSELRKGTTFKVFFPANTSKAVKEAVTFDEEIRLPRGHGELILLVDDEEPIRHIAQKTLEQFGYRVLVARNGAEGVALYVANQHDVSVVVTDMAMPIMDGPALIFALKGINPAVRIIGSSGLASEGCVAKAIDAGVQYFVPKPYTAEALLKTLHKISDAGESLPSSGEIKANADN